MLDPGSQRPPCPCPLRQQLDSLIHKSPGGLRLCPLGAPDHPLDPGQAALGECSLYPWAPKLGCRHLVEAGARGMETPPRNGVVDLEEVRPGRNVFVCISRNDALSSLVLP